MSLQFILGSSGAGKSTLLYEKVIKESMMQPDKNFIVLVPEQFTMQTQKDLVTSHPKKGIMNIDVLSFGRLAHRVFEEVGGNDKIILDDVGKNFILRKIAKQYEGQLTVIGNNIKKPGYISEVKSVISEFTQYNIGADTFEKIMNAPGVSKSLYYKLQDIKKLYEGFFAYLKGKYITGEELLDVLCQVASKSEILKGSVVVLDGFTGFTPVQNQLLKELMRICHKVIVTATIDPKENPYVYQHPYQLFALSKQMLSSLIQIAKEQQIVVEDSVILPAQPVKRYESNEPMAFLEAHLFRHRVGSYEKEQQEISIHACSNPRAEVIYAAGEIRRLVREYGYRYRDIGVIVSDMTVYADEIVYLFEKFNIPVFMDYKRNVLLNSFVEYVRSLLAMVEDNFSYEGVFRFLRTGLFPMEGAEIDELENYVIALGIKGYKSWQQPFLRRKKGMEESELTRLNGMRRKFVEELDSLVLLLKQRRKTVRDVTQAIYEFLVKEGMQQKLKEYEHSFETRQELALAKEYGQVYRILIELFDQFVELLGEEYISLKEYSELLDAGLAEAKIGVIPPSIDQVTAGDLKRTRLNHIKALFVLGANDAYLPGKLGGQGLLSEGDRSCLQKERIALAPGPKEEAYIQKFYLYLQMTKPSKYLSISFSKITAGGTALRPAYLIGEIKKLYPRIQIANEEERAVQDRELTPEIGMELLIEAIRKNKTLSKEYEELYTWFRSNPLYQEKLLELLKAGEHQCKFAALDPKIAEALYGESLQASVTRLENYAACPFLQFAGYGLQLNERQEYEFQALDIGNIFHKAMELFSGKVSNLPGGWSQITDDVRKELVEESVEESIVDYENTILYSSARNEYMITRLKRLLNRTTWALVWQLAKGDFVPDGYEVSFGHGKIDRIDICEEEDKVYVKVIDYKTGSKSFDITSLYYGLQMQLFVYLEEALKLEQKKYPGKTMIPAGIFYYQMKDPMVDKMEKEAVEKAILSELRMDGLVNENEAVIQHLDRNLQGSSSVIPVSRNKSASLSALSKTATSEEFDLMLSHVKEKMNEMNRGIKKGNIVPSPYEYGNATGCDFCKFKAVCGFDRTMDGYEYRRIRKMKKEEIFEKMKGGEEQ